MDANTGNHAPEELARELASLNEAIQTTRREDLASRIEGLEKLAECIRVELRLDEDALQQVKTRYRGDFNFFDRINPFNQERRQAHAQDVAPVDQEVTEDRKLLIRCCERLEWVRNAAQLVEWRTNWHGGIAGVYNEQTGFAEWRESWHTGVAGVYHPDRQCVEWRESWKHGVAGVFNPLSRQIEWNECWHGGVAGVFNPKRQIVEWRDSWHHGVAGIFNPLSEAVEWKESWKGGVAGAWLPETGAVEWNESWKSGMACLYFDGSIYRSSGSYYGDED
jgi:hypothetical protein